MDFFKTIHINADTYYSFNEGQIFHRFEKSANSIFILSDTYSFSSIMQKAKTEFIYHLSYLKILTFNYRDNVPCKKIMIN